MKPLIVCGLLLAMPLGARAQNPYADFVVSYVTGTGAGFEPAYDNPSVALGAPTSSATITAPAYTSTNIVGVGEGGELTVGFDTPMINDPADHAGGMDFTIFGNQFFVLGGGGITGNYDHTGLTVWVSQNGVTFYQLVAPDGLPHGADDLYPTEGSGNPFLPLSPSLSLSSFAGLTPAQALGLYNGSAGGSSYSISWAEDADGHPVDLSSISYIEVEGSDGYGYIDSFARVETIPEPANMLLVLMGAAGLLCMRRSRKAQAALIIGAVSLFTALASGQAQTFTLSNIKYWVGSGTNQSALVILWNDGITPDSLVFGYNWNALASGSAPTIYDMMQALQSADPNLEFTANPEFNTPSTGDYALYSAFYNLTGGAGPVVGLPDNLGGTENGYAPFGDHYREGWFTGFWGELIGIGNPYNGGSWNSDIPLGLAVDTLNNDSWYGLSFSTDVTNFTIPDPGFPSALFPVPVPEPPGVWLFLLAVGGLVGPGIWRRPYLRKNNLLPPTPAAEIRTHKPHNPVNIPLGFHPLPSALLVVLCLVVVGNASGQFPDAQPVTLTNSADHVTLANGIVTFQVTKVSGDIDALKYHSTSILAEPGYLDWVGGGNNHIRNGAFAVISDPAQNDGNIAEVSISQKYAGQGPPFDVDLHYVLRRGDSGLYCFVLFHHVSSYPAGGIAQSRWVLRLDDKVFDFINVDEQRRREMPPSDTPAQILGPKESSMFTEGPFKGLITDKYHFFVDAGDHFVHGWIGTQKRIGCWVVYGSTESQNGGPTKQHNTAHFGRMLFKILTCGHYGSGSGLDFAAGEEWQKIYGPWMLYMNSGGDRDALWADAKKQAAFQRASWPPVWMNHPEFSLAAARGAVKGRLQITDPQDPSASPANAWVGLAAPQPDWQKQGKGYQFWVHAAADGSIAIPNIRPGQYTLYAFANGVMDEYRRDGVRVAAGGAVDLGRLDWSPVRYGKQLWQIGTPDRTAKEFRHGDDYRQWGLWLKYPVDFPNGVNFVIGQSKERTDWNYAQVNVQKDGQWVGTTWNILFDMDHPPISGAATLRLALASAYNAKLAIDVNGQRVGGFRTGADNAMIRAGIHGQYSEEDIAFDAALLKPGRNAIALEQTAGGSVQKSVMYDCVRLELDDTHPFDKSKIRPRAKPAPPAEAKDTEE